MKSHNITLIPPVSRELRDLILYRFPAPVTQLCQYHGGDVYPVCPRCRLTLAREYQSYCDRCGQALDWTDYDQAAVIRLD